MQTQKISISIPQGRLREITRREEVSKAKIVTGKYESHLEFSGWLGGSN